MPDKSASNEPIQEDRADVDIDEPKGLHQDADYQRETLAIQRRHNLLTTLLILATIAYATAAWWPIAFGDKQTIEVILPPMQNLCPLED